MRAITYRRYGPPEVLQLEDVPAPKPKDDEVLIRVHAAEATKADCEMRAFHFAVKWFWLPLRLAIGITRPRNKILGGYFAGVVEAVGSKVTRLAVGDEVYGSSGLGFGAYGEFTTVRERATVVKKPANMSFEQAAAVPLGGLNALHFLRVAAVRPGERVLINGAGGSIGAHAVQIAKAMGAEVTAVDGPVKRALIERLGADHFIDYTQEDFWTRGETWDVVFDMVPHCPYAAILRVLNPGGRYLKGNPRFADMLRAPWTTRTTDKRVSMAFAKESHEELDALRTMIEAGELTSIVDTVYPMEQAAEAHRRVETEQRSGAIVLAIGGD
jgi:NADPH:quinone reductase-like Zn-dependent oxidoreductase